VAGAEEKATDDGYTASIRRAQSGQEPQAPAATEFATGSWPGKCGWKKLGIS